MKRLAVLCAVAFLGTAGSASAAAPELQAREWLLENPATGEVLAQHDATLRVPIASITKLMTVLVALDHEKLTDVVSVDPQVTTVGQESIELRPDELITVGDLVKGALIQSANDAADALALSVAPSFTAFASLMNEKAHELGLDDSNFVRPDGLDAPGEYSTARDVTRLALDAMRNSVIRQTVGETTDEISGGRTLHTWNDLLGVVPGVFGVKTGHTSLAGWGQVIAVHANDVTLYVTILGSPSRTQRNDDLERLVAWGLDQYRVVEAISPSRSYAEVELPFGRAPLQLVARSSQFDRVLLGETLTQRVVAPVALSLPVRQGEIVGRIEVWSGKKLIGTRVLVADRSVRRPDAMGRIRWYAKRMLHHFAGFFE